MEPMGREPGAAPEASTAAPMADRIARVVTEAFAPAVLLTVLLVVVGWHAYGDSLVGVAWGLTAALFASVIPFAVILRGVRGGALTDHHIGRREQRRRPLLIGLGSVAVGLVALVALGADRELLAALGAVACSAIVALAVSHWWKVSLHTAGAAGFVVILAEVFGPVMLATAPLVLVVGWSRVQLGDHTPAQVIVGGLVGALVAGLTFAALR